MYRSEAIILTACDQTHRRDQLIEWIKGLLAVPFVLHSNPAAVLEPQTQSTETMAAAARKKYLGIMQKRLGYSIDLHLPTPRNDLWDKMYEAMERWLDGAVEIDL